MIDPDLIRPARTRPLRRVEYDRLVESGAFRDERLELLYGLLVTMSPQGALHAAAIEVLADLLAAALGHRARIRVQLPLAVSDDSEPEPDIAVVERVDPRREHPRTAFLVVEVADSSLRDDRLVKGRLYAEAGIAEYWIIDVSNRRVERYLAPDAGKYGQLTTHSADEALALASFPDVTVSLAAVLAR